MKKFLKPIVLAILAGSLAVVSCTQDNRAEIDGIKAEIESIKQQMTAGEIDVKAQINTLQYLLQSYKDEVNPKLTALQTQLNSDYAELSDAEAKLNKALQDAQAALQAQINLNSEAIDETNEELQAAIEEYKGLINGAIADFQAAIEKVKKEQAEVDGAQSLLIAGLGTQLELYKAALDESINALAKNLGNLATTVGTLNGAVENMKDNVGDLEAAVDQLQKDVEANLDACITYTDLLEEAVKATTDALEKRIKKNEADIKKLNEETIPELEQAIADLMASIEGIGDEVEDLKLLVEKKLDADIFIDFVLDYAEWKASVDDTLETYQEAIDGINTYIEDILDPQIAAIEEIVEKLNGEVTDEGSVKYLILQSEIKIGLALAAVKEELEGEIADLKSELEAKISDITENILSIDGRLVVVEGDIETINGQIESLNGQITTLDGKITALELYDDFLLVGIESLQTEIDTINGKIDTINGDGEGSFAYAISVAVEALKTELGTTIAQLSDLIAQNHDDIVGLQGRVDALEDEIAKLKVRIQSLVFVPQYQDLKFGIPFASITDGTTTLYMNQNLTTDEGLKVVYKVAPNNLAEILAEKVNEAISLGVDPIFTFEIESGLKTRAASTDPKLTIVKAEGVKETGKITFFLTHENFDPAKINEYAVSIRVDDDNYGVHVASEYVQTVGQGLGTGPATFVVDMGHLYKPDRNTGLVATTDVIDVAVVQKLGIPYTDGNAHDYFEGYELAAQEGTAGPIRTFSQIAALGYDIPVPTVKATYDSGTNEFLTEDLSKGAASTFSVKIKNGSVDNMVNTKNYIAADLDLGTANTKAYNFAFNDGLGEDAGNTVNVKLNVGIAKHNEPIKFVLPYEMKWDYATDKAVDHAHIDDTGAWADTYYTRSDFIVKPALIIDDVPYELDGSNKVFGLRPSDFDGLIFNTNGTVENLIPDYEITGSSDANKTLALAGVEISQRLTQKDYSLEGFYALPCIADPANNAIAEVIITTQDRNTDPINIVLPSYSVKLLGSDFTSGGDGYYTIASNDFADQLMQAYYNNGIFPNTYVKSQAFGNVTDGEFYSTYVAPVYAAHEVYDGRDACFAVESETTGTFIIESAGVALTSARLHEVASNYEAKPWILTVRSYIGQEIKITWPISADPIRPYKFNTSGLNTANNSFAIPATDVWVLNGESKIVQAKTEFDLMKNNTANIQVMTTVGSVEQPVDISDFNGDTYKLEPVFTLVGTPKNVDVVLSDVTPKFMSKVRYYGQDEYVGLKSELNIVSGDTRFLVADSDKMYVENTGAYINTVKVKQFNPIAEPASTVQNINMSRTGSATLQIKLKDIQDYFIYDNGVRKDNSNPYGDTILNIFGHIKFSVLSVNGSSVTTGWTLDGAVSGISDTPGTVILKTSNVAVGTYEVEVKANTQWKDYTYKFTVNVQE